MRYYRSCPYCGANLDPGERCDCPDGKFSALTPENQQIVSDKIAALYAIQQAQKEAVPSAANTRDGEMDPRGNQPIESAPIVPGGERNVKNGQTEK